MGQHVIKMPDIGEGIAEVEVAAWHVQPGDEVAEDQVLAEVMTDKATVEIPSPVKGTVLALGGKVGEVMAVGAELLRLEVEGTGNAKAATAKPVDTTTPARSDAAPEPAAAKASDARPAMEARDDDKRAAETHSAGKVESTRGLQATRPCATALRKPGAKPLASPAVRRRAWDLGIELQFVPGSGPAGRVLHEDLDARLASHGAAVAGTAGQAAAAMRGHRLAPNEREEAVEVIGLRRRIAQKMQESKRRIPHYSYVEEVDVTELEALRARLNQRFGETRGKLTVLPLLLRAMVLAVRDHPQVNARFDDEAGIVTRYGAVHAGIATQTAGGLMVPVLRHAEVHDLWSAAAEIARLSEAARGGKATREELGGSTITITSLGPLGGIVTTPVINHPEVAIVGVNRIVERPVVRDGLIVIRKTMNLSSSFDHRVVDGMDAAEFIQAVRGLLECPSLLFVE